MVCFPLPVFCIFFWFLSCIGLIQANDNHGATILTPFIKNGSIDIARSLAKVDPAHFLGLESYSGFITVKEKYNSNLFFWYFPHATPKDVPWVIWLQGGPGVTSLLGVFEGIGPYKIEHEELKLRELTWNTDYSLLFVDNPVGAGFSFTNDEQGYVNNEEDVADQLLEFTAQFLKVFPELKKAPLFIAGQSYSGKYVPAFGSYIHNNKSANINLKGIIIGNGLIDPKSQLTEGHSGLCGQLGMLEAHDLVKLERVQKECVDFIDQGKMIDAANKFNESIEFIKKKSGVNIYNFEADPSKGARPLEPYVTSAEVRRGLHVGKAPFDFNNQHVYEVMLPDIMNSTKPFVEELLEHYGVLSYTGQLDVILPYALAKPMYEQFRWSRRKEYVDAPRVRLRKAGSGQVAAYKKSGGNFVEVLVRHTGHMVTTEQPELIKSIVDTFVEEFK